MLDGGRGDARRGVLIVPSVRAGVRSRIRDEEGGWTLIELLVGAVVGLFVAGIALATLNLAVQAQPVTSERAGQIQEGRSLIERISRELRQGEQISAASSSALTLVTFVDSATCGGDKATTARLCQVSYSCTGGICTRTEGNPDGSGSPTTTQVASGIRNAPVFSYSPDTVDPTYVGVELSFPADGGGETVTFSDGVALRNYFQTGA